MECEIPFTEKFEFSWAAQQVGVSPQLKHEPNAEFAERILCAIDEMSEEDWSQLDYRIQKWFNSFC